MLVARPLLWLTNRLAYGLLRLFGVGKTSRASQALSTEELRTVVAEAGPLIPARHRQMLLSILDLGQVTVNDIMIPRQEISGIDVQENWDDILDQLRQTPHTRLPVYDGELDNLFGILHMKRVAQELARGTLTRERLIEVARSREPYFVPESTALTVQLTQFQRNRRRLAFVVNEYGDIEGLVTLEDILEEIVGEFTTDPATVTHKDIHPERPGRLHRQCERHHPGAQPRAAMAVAHRWTENHQRPVARAAGDDSRSRHGAQGRRLPVRGAADRGQRDPHGAGVHARATDEITATG